HSTKWVEDEVDASLWSTAAAPVLEVEAPDGDAPLVEKTVPVEVDGRRYTVKVWLPDAPVVAAAAPAGAGRARPKPAVSSGGGASGGSGTVAAPMQGTIVKVLVEAGATVATGDALVVLEAMKMENQINAEVSGTVKEVRVAAGDSVGNGDILVIIE
ncbi:MAG TPA: biotin/lipoyl-containing protein, partial [Acidimicrobiia bacterium]|nr:biotin/lipoyl-containing protein [Acidimicrobiia bacterium]